MYNEDAAMFEAQQVGSFFEVHTVEDEHGLSLVGTARINKRNADVTDKIIQMYNTGRLKFSFEIWASEITEEDGIIVVDAAPGNQLTAMAIVTTPALPAAVALGLAAEMDIHAFEDKVWRLMIDKFIDSGCWNIIWMGLEYAVVYVIPEDKMIRVSYRIENGELVETEAYEVVFARIEEVNKEMDKEIIAEATELTAEEVAQSLNASETTVTITTDEFVISTADTVVNVSDTTAAEPVEAEAKNEDECAEETAEVEVEETDPEVDNLRRELAQLQAELAQYKKAEEKAKLAEKQNAARKYAEREHLDLNSESVKAAIENADYEALAAEVMAKPAETDKQESYRVVAEMKMDSPFGNMFEKAN